MSKRVFCMLCLVLFSAGLLTNCEKTPPPPPPFECRDGIGCVDIAPGEPIRIGVIQVMSGPYRSVGIDQVRSIELAVTDRGEKLLGHPVALEQEDSLCSGEGGATAAYKITTDPRIVAIIGTSCSGEAVRAAPIMSEAGYIMISGSNTAPSLTSMDGIKGADRHDGYFRTAHNDAMQGRAAAAFAFQHLGIKKAATIDMGDPYTNGLAEVFKNAFTAFGGSITTSTAINKGDTDMEPVLTSVAKSGTELLFFPTYPPEGNLIAMQSKNIEEFKDIIIMTSEGMLVSSFVESTGPAGLGVYFVAPLSPTGPAYETFISKYTKKYGETPSSVFAVNAYDAANLVFDAIKTASVKGEDGTLHVGRRALRDALHATSGYKGLTGSLTCDQYGDCGAAKFKIVRMDDLAAGYDGLVSNVVYTFIPGQ